MLRRPQLKNPSVVCQETLNLTLNRSARPTLTGFRVGPLAWTPGVLADFKRTIAPTHGLHTAYIFTSMLSPTFEGFDKSANTLPGTQQQAHGRSCTTPEILRQRHMGSIFARVRVQGLGLR